MIGIANGDQPTRTILSEYHAAGACTVFFMIRDGAWKFVYYVGERAQLFNLDEDPHETRDVAGDPDNTAVLARCEQKLREVVDPEQANQNVFDDQAAMIKRHGGRDVVLGRGDFGYTPAPGEQPQYN